MDKFVLHSEYQPTGDQPQAIEQLVEGFQEGKQFQTLLGVTGSGKTFTMANVIEKLNKPTLIIAHNKTLAAQLYGEFKEFFPENAVEYFVSYYDYYQPEAYVPSTDTYIEKDSAINDEIDRLRHGATEALLTRRDVIVVSSVSCIYGIGSPAHYEEMSLPMWQMNGEWKLALGAFGHDVAATHRHGDDASSSSVVTPGDPSSSLVPISQLDFIRRLVAMQYHRNDLAFERGNFRVMGDTIDLFPANGEFAYRFEFGFDTLEEVKIVDPLTLEVREKPEHIHIFPNTHYATPVDQLEKALVTIRAEYEERMKYFEKHQKYLEAQRLSQRTKYDLEMLKETGFVKGIENYSRHLDGRQPGEPPSTLLDFFPDDYLMIVDESHMTLPQVRGMYNGDHARKVALVDYGFRLPSALDNRPLTYGEFQKHINQAIYVSATPGEYELEVSPKPAEQVIRPTGLLDPEIEVRSSDGQIDDLMEEIDKRIAKGQRILITTLTKRMAEDLSDHLKERGVKTAYIHSDIDTLERGDILRDLRAGVYDVLVGINLLREGLDLPEVSLVAILDADKEGFLRTETSLMQTIGRAARNVHGHVIMYADTISPPMRYALDETKRRREVQEAYNKEHGITPRSVEKSVREVIEATKSWDETEEAAGTDGKKPLEMTKRELGKYIQTLEKQMREAASKMEFEKAAMIRDRIFEYKAHL